MFYATQFDANGAVEWSGSSVDFDRAVAVLAARIAAAGLPVDGTSAVVIDAVVDGKPEKFTLVEDLADRFDDPVVISSVTVVTALGRIVGQADATVFPGVASAAIEDLDAVATGPSGSAMPSEAEGFELADISEFGLSEQPEHVSVGGIVEGGAAVEPESETAFVLDRWDRRRGKDLLETFRGAIPVGDDHAALAMADFYAAAYQPDPVLAQKCSDQQRHEFLEQLLETPEYHALHSRTAINDVASELACGSFAQAYGVLVADAQKQQPEGSAGGSGKNAFKKKMKVISAIGNGLKNASNVVSDYEDARDAFGSGLGNGGNGKMDTKALANLFKRVRDNKSLARICELAGRYRRRGQSMQRRKIVHGRDDVVGIELSGDLGRAVPNELAYLVVPELELLELRKIAENQLLSREYRGVEKIARGPVMIFLDESGSMSGEPSYHAKAFALTMAWIAQHQKRWCTLVAFSGGADKESMRAIVLEPGKWKQEDLFGWLEGFIGGGTTVEWLDRKYMEPMYAAAKAPEGKTDVVIVTDAEVGLSESARKSCLAWKADSKAKIISLVIGCDDAGALKGVSDKWFAVPSLDVESEAVAEAFSI